MIGISFDKAKAESILDSLKNGKPIELLSPEGWTGHDMLILAGACFFGALSQGPGLYRNTDFSKVPAERREAIDDTFFQDLHLAIRFYSQLIQLVCDGNYESSGYEPRCRAAVWFEDGEMKIQPGEGMPEPS
jgi:hypothetical protein